jgi:hypothetical protein
MKSNNNNNNDDDDEDDDDDDDNNNNNNNTAMGSVHARGNTFLTFGLKALTETNISRLATELSALFSQNFTSYGQSRSKDGKVDVSAMGAICE